MFVRFKIYVALIAGLTIGVVSAATSVPTYTTVYKMGDGRAFMVDRGSIAKKRNIRRFIQVIDLGTTSDNGVRSRRSLEEGDCKANKTRTIEEWIYDSPIATGKVLRESKEVSEWSVEEEGSPGKAILKFVCEL
jgi:hypothetical protein